MWKYTSLIALKRSYNKPVGLFNAIFDTKDFFVSQFDQAT